MWERRAYQEFPRESILIIDSLTRQFGAKAGKADGKCLKSRQGLSIIHRKSIVRNFPELE